MAYNLLISYDLIPPGQKYEQVIETITSLGSYRKLQYSLFYLNTQLTPGEVYTRVGAVMDANDNLVVANVYGMILCEPEAVCDAINQVWFANAA